MADRPEDYDLGTQREPFSRADIERGYKDEIPPGARRGMTDQSGNDLLESEAPRSEFFEDMPQDYRDRQMERERELMHGGFIERPGLCDENYGRANIKRL